jgi:NAD(P)-dependent dehydrogenase (short-subunit alcohol dehydrogenase family)
MPAELSDQSLIDRPVIVTGGSRGLGRAMALALLQAGARVAVVASRQSPQLDETLARAGALGAASRTIAVVGDVGQPEDCDRIVAEVYSAFGALHVLINNAGVPMSGPGEPVWRADVHAWRRMVQTNVDGPFFMTRAAAPMMVAQGFGKIVNVSTGLGTMVRKQFAPYGPSKAFLEAASRIWAQEFAGTGVTVNVLLPGGAVDTAADVTGQPTPGRAFQPASIMAPPVLWLASDRSNGHTGQRILASRWDETLPLPERIAAARQDGATEPQIM